MIEILHPQSRDEWLALRQQTIGASEIAALVGASPWETAFSLYSKRVNKSAPEPENAAMRRGRHLEAVAIEILREERPNWTVKANLNLLGGYGFTSTLIFRDSSQNFEVNP